MLRKGCEAFVKQFKKEADFNPFEQCTTIAVACDLYWRRSIEEGTEAALIASRRSHSPLRTLFAFYQCSCRLSLTPSRSRKRSIACYRDQNDITNPSNPTRSLGSRAGETVERGTRGEKPLDRAVGRTAKRGKLTFPLCMACVREQQPKPMLERSALCTHTDQERQLRGTWCTPEIEKAMKKFQQYLSTLDPPYQLKVLSRNHPFFLIFRGPDAENKIILLKTDNHYDGYTTIMLMYANLC